MTSYNLNFMHPQYGTTFNVDIDVAFTVEEMINNLLMSGFINENKAGFDLALMDKVLDRQATFQEIQDLYDGAVIRIIAHKEVKEKTAVSNKLTLKIKHPSEVLLLDLNLSENAILNEVIQQAADSGFIKGAQNIFHLQKGEKLLDLQKSLLDNGLKSGDYLQIVQNDLAPKTNPIETAVNELNTELKNLQTQFQTELIRIKDALPATNMIPIDPTRAVNPTMEAYESIDSIVRRLRQASNQEPLKPIRPLPIKLLAFLGIFLLIVLVILVSVIV